MHALWTKKTQDVARGSDRARRRPLEFENQHGFISHAAGSTEHGFDGGLDRLDDAEADLVIAVGGDPLEMLEQELAQPLHLGEALPPERVAPAVEEVQHAGAGLVHPEPIELFAEYVGLEQAAGGGGEGWQLRTAGGPPSLSAPQGEPTVCAAAFPHRGARPRKH